MPGYGHLIALGQANGTTGEVEPLYQFNYVSGGNTFFRSLNGYDELLVFLQSDLGLQTDIVKRIVDELQTSRRANVGELEISDNQAAEMGMSQVSSDF